MKKLILLPIIFLAFFYSCKKDPVLPDDTFTPAMGRDTLFYIMKDWYLWQDMPEASSVTATSKEAYKDPYELLEAMRFQALDRWSSVMDYDKFMAEIQSEFVGFGFRVGVDNSGKARIAMIYNKSPLYASGVRRGWIIKTISGVDPAPILLANDAAAYTALIGPGTAGITKIFVFTNPNDGTDITVSATKATFTTNPVLGYDTLHLKSGITGHLVFESFYEPAPAQLATAFAYFKANDIKDLIVDLRYNQGGYLDIAQTLSSYIAGNSYEGIIFAKLQHHIKRVSYDRSLLFKSTPYSMALPRLVVITSRTTTSASEDVINGLDPIVNVVTIGDTTNGKPTGMYSWYAGKKYAMHPISFKLVNSQNQGEFFDGIFPSRTAPDDITRDFSDREESCLKEAIYYLENGSVSTKGIQEFKRTPQFSEKPSWMNNAFVKKK